MTTLPASAAAPALPVPAPLPRIIQGGMGIAVSDWQLARTVSQHGGLGVVSGTGIDTVLLRRLQDGDPGGHLRRVLATFPNPLLVQACLGRFFRPGAGRPANPMPACRCRRLAATATPGR
ncbi:hypothetical protein [Deinococcus multiflagellatus]|uniref:Nitronate monooxygenase domain-containing protein n=1 Tax=Deinococcus multiflagellatus TaxID=1656887 RepID=A0ABW1ZGT0_9DEIO